MLRLVRLCGKDLDIRLVELDDSTWVMAQALRDLTPSERVDHAQHVARQFQAIREAGMRSGIA